MTEPTSSTLSQRAGSTVIEVAASHAVYASQPASVAEIISTAIEGSA